jgi:hypothetical protein
VPKTGQGANRRTDASTDYKADHGMLAAPGCGGCRDADDVFTFYRDIGSAFLEGEHFIGHIDEFAGLTLHVGFDYFDSPACLQAIQSGP